MTMLRCGLIGAHIGRSRLALALDVLCRRHGLTLEFTPLDTAEMPRFDFERTVQGCIAKGWTGVTVTHPWKLAARAFAGGEMMRDVAHLTASNTLVFGAPLRGFNTDYTGFLGAWAAEMKQPPGRVAVAGAGGVAGAIVPALAELGAEDVGVWDTVAERAEALAAQCNGPVRAVPMSEAEAVARAANGLVNATALGMGDDARSAFPDAVIGHQSWAFDAVYTPVETPFLKTAADRGFRCLTGFDLFRHMALGSFAAYTGIEADPETCLPLLEALRPGAD